MHPILFSIGPISVSSFGFFAALAFLLATFLVWKFAAEEILFSKALIKEEYLFDGVFIFTLTSFFGGRAIFVLSHFDKFGFNFLSWFLVRRASGISFLGGFLVGALALFFFCLKKKISFYGLADLFSLAGTTSLSLGFIGAFLDGLFVGAKTSLPWGVLSVGFEGRRHPVSLLASIFFLILFFILKKVRIFALKERKEGIVTFSFLTLSSFFLFLLEFLKEDRIYFRWLKFDQIIYLGFFLAGGGLLEKSLKRNLKEDLRKLILKLKKC